LLLGGETTSEDTQALYVDGAYLFDENASSRVIYVDFGPERCRLGAGRCGGHQHDRPWKKGIRLHDDAEATPSLFMPDTFG
jgi:hypothetical protein